MNRSFKGAWKLAFFYSILGGFLTFPGSEISAQQAPAESAGLLGSNFFTQTSPPEWKAAQLGGLSASCSSFQAPLANMTQALTGAMASGGLGAGGMGSLMSGMCPMAAGVSLESVCTGTDTPPDSSAMTCESLALNPQALDQMKFMVQAASCTNQCKLSKIQAIQSKIQCINSMENTLKAQMGALTKVYNDNIQKMEADVAKITAAEEDREAQAKDVLDKLQPQETGKRGLLALQKDTNDMLASLPAEINEIRSKYQMTANKRRRLDNKREERKMALTMDCFSTRPVNSYSCTVNGPPVSPKEYLTCRYRQNQNLGRNGFVEQNATVRAQAEGKAQSLDGLLTQIAGDTPKNPQMSNDESVDTPLNVLSIADVDNIFGASLSTYRIGGTDAEQFVLATLKSCNMQATSQSDREASRDNSEVKKLSEEIKNEEEGIKSEVQSMLSKQSQLYSENMSALVGQNVPLDTSRCQAASGPVQVQCLNDVKKKMTDLVQGGTKMNLQIKGNNPETTINFSCSGLNGCVTDLQNLARNIRVEKDKLGTFKKQYVLQAKQRIESYTKQMAEKLSGPSQMLSNELLALNGALASLGSQGVPVAQIQGEDIEYDPETGLPRRPRSTLNLVGQFVNPPLPDMKNGFGSVTGGLSQAQARTEANGAAISASMVRIQTLMTSCQANQLQNQAQAVQDAMANAQNCHNHPNCKNHLDEMVNMASRIAGSPGMQMGVTSSLSTGISSACENPYTTAPPEKLSYSQFQAQYNSPQNRRRNNLPVGTAYNNYLVSKREELQNWRLENQVGPQRSCGALFSTMQSLDKAASRLGQTRGSGSRAGGASRW